MTDDPPFIVIFTDLDGTLLDHNSYDWEAAIPALDLCQRLQIPIIPVSSKTRAEMEVLQHKLELSSPFISENGGGIFPPKDGSYSAPAGTIFAKNREEWTPGLPYEFLVNALREIREELGWDIRGFSEMTLKEISHLTSLDPDSARLAAMREYDEPFIVLGREDVDNDALYTIAERKGLNITSGGRFYHLHGENDKGRAVEKLISWYRELYPELLTIGLGDSPNDFSMLKRVNYPVLIRSSRHFPEIQKVIRGLRMTKESGPRGWNSAVSDLIGRLIPVIN